MDIIYTSTYSPFAHNQSFLNSKRSPKCRNSVFMKWTTTVDIIIQILYGKSRFYLSSDLFIKCVGKLNAAICFILYFFQFRIFQRIEGKRIYKSGFCIVKYKIYTVIQTCHKDTAFSQNTVTFMPYRYYILNVTV